MARIERVIKVIAHRGASAYEPENTLRAFKLALEMNVDAVELDVRQSRDGYLVVMHDPTVDRTTDGTGCVEEMSISEIKELDAGKGERVPQLEEVLELVKGKAELFLETKLPNVETEVIDLVKKYEMEEEVWIISHIHPALKKVKELEPKIRTMATFDEIPVYPERLALDCGADAISPHYRVILWYPYLLERAKKHNILVLTCVDDEKVWEKLINSTLYGIFTNIPDLLIKRLKRR